MGYWWSERAASGPLAGDKTGHYEGGSYVLWLYTARMRDEIAPDRKRLRAEGYDYAQPAGYFVTICVQDRARLFGEITENRASLSTAGLMVQAQWSAIPGYYPFVERDTFVVMPNHLHGILILQPVDGEMPPASLSDIIGTFKSRTTHLYAQGVRIAGWPPYPGQLWQRSFHDRIIRGDRHLERLREYVEGNPGNWPWDAENPESSQAVATIPVGDRGLR